MTTKHAYFSDATFDFLRALKKHNNREWFAKNKARYEEDVRDPALRFIEDIAPALRKISPRIRADARPNGGSLFRIYRDTRFAADKSPYKTYLAMRFSREGAAVHGPEPGYYLRIEPGNCLAGGGVHLPEGPVLAQIRDAIVANPAAWKRAIAGADGVDYSSDWSKLKRAPAGYPADHSLVEELKRREFTWTVAFSEADVCRADFMDRFLASCRAAAPFDRFLAKAVGALW